MHILSNSAPMISSFADIVKHSTHKRVCANCFELIDLSRGRRLPEARCLGRHTGGPWCMGNPRPIIFLYVKNINIFFNEFFSSMYYCSIPKKIKKNKSIADQTLFFDFSQ